MKIHLSRFRQTFFHKAKEIRDVFAFIEDGAQITFN
jgi:hypothetical protein